jgi:hypothetical protein
MNHHKAVELLLIHYYDKNLLLPDEQKRLISAYASAVQMTQEEAANQLEIDI